MKIRFARSCSILAIALGFVFSAQAQDLIVAANDVAKTDTDSMGTRTTSRASSARLQRLAEASFALREMAESLDGVASQVEQRMVRLAASQATNHAGHASN